MSVKAVSVSAVAIALVALTLPSAALASLVYDSSILAQAQGFGTAPRNLTLQATGPGPFESGGLGVSATGAIVFGSVIPDASVYLGNGVTNQGGTASLPNPLFDAQKYGAPTIGSLGITSADQIGILFNATEPGGDSVNVLDVTLKFYSSTGVLLGAIDGQQNFTSSNPGNGVAGFTFIVDQAQRDYVNGLIAAGPETRLALEASIADFAGGPESFLIYNLSAPITFMPEPATYALMLAGLGAVGFVGRRRKAKHRLGTVETWRAPAHAERGGQEMTQHDSHSLYKGYRVTARWTELEPAAGERRFQGSYAIAPPAGQRPMWHHDDSVLYTRATAAGHAVARAHRHIDGGVA